MKKSISFLLTFLLFISSFANNTALAKNQSVADALNDECQIEIYSEDASKIDELIDQRGDFACLGEWDKVEEIDKELEKFDVEKLSSEEVYEKFCDTETQAPYINKPKSDNIYWFLTKTTLKYNGTVYEVHTLKAQPNQKASNLRVCGGEVISLDDIDIMAAFVDGLKVAASAGINKLLEKAPREFKIMLTIFEMLKPFISKLSKKTIISSAHLVYSYVYATTVSFKYVKIKGRSDNESQLTYISTKGTCSAGWQYTKLTSKDGLTIPNIIQGKTKPLSITPVEYDKTINAVKAYDNPYANKAAYVWNVDITGINGKVIKSINTILPDSPAQIF